MTGQKHGKQLEDVLKALLYPGAADAARPATAKFDIEPRFDKKLGLATSIKAAKDCKTIALADARSFWSINQPFRLIVTCRRQKDKCTKEFYAAHEFIIHGTMMDDLRGRVSLSQVKELHEGLSLKNFPKGDHENARKWAQKKKQTIASQGALITLNPKIDSKTQRRLQCSIRMSVLKNLAEKHPVYQAGAINHTIYTDSIGSMILPQLLKSESRQVRTNR